MDKKQYLLLHVPTLLPDKIMLFAFHILSTTFHNIVNDFIVGGSSSDNTSAAFLKFSTALSK